MQSEIIITLTRNEQLRDTLFDSCGAGVRTTFRDDPTSSVQPPHKHKGLSFLIEFYDVEHLHSMDETIDDLLIICQQNGGVLA